jgi:hypothetical protein
MLDLTFIFEEIAHAGAASQDQLRDVLDDLALGFWRQSSEPFGEADLALAREQNDVLDSHGGEVLLAPSEEREVGEEKTGGRRILDSGSHDVGWISPNIVRLQTSRVSLHL